jgi:hypothetical protein
MKIIAALGCIAVAVASIYYGITSLINTPLVVLSYSTEQCVKVESSDPSHTCDNLPESYFTVYSR